MPASIDPDVEHDLAGGAVDRDLGDAGGQRVVLHHADTNSGVGALARPVRHVATARSSVCMRGALPMIRAGRSSLRLLAISSRKLGGEGIVGVADAAPGEEPRAAGLDDMLGELVGMDIADRRASSQSGDRRRRVPAMAAV
jgi:hypothetical protein